MRSCGPLRLQQADTHPTTISHGFGKGYLEEFDWTGTRDPIRIARRSAAALDFHEQLGGAALRQRNIDPRRRGRVAVARRLNSEIISGDPNGAMRLVRLPTGVLIGQAVRAGLLQAGTDAPVHAIGGALWLRLSAFAYNELEDYARLADIVARVSREIAE